MTKDDRAREKQLGYMKHHLTNHEKFKDNKAISVNIVWSKSMVVIIGADGKEKKVGWFSDNGGWCTSASGKLGQQAVNDSMK